MSLTVEVAGKSDVGCVRKNNEDNLGWDARYGIFVVCDGMGGAAAGEVASKLGVDMVLAYFRDGKRTGDYPVVGPAVETRSPRCQNISSAIAMANAAVFDQGSKHATHRGMGSTICVLYVDDNFFSIGHVGDSRIYLVRQGTILQLTNDHSLVMEQVRRGLITREEAEHSEMQNIIIRALGSEPTVTPDLEDYVAFPGDVILIGSDGLTKLVSDHKMHELVVTSPNISVACDRLIAEAKHNGGDDNVTCLLVRIKQQPWYKKLLAFFGIGGGSAQSWQNSI